MQRVAAMQSALARSLTDDDTTTGEFLDSEHRLMQVLLERIGSLPEEKRIEIAAAFYAQLGDDYEDNAPWRNRYRKELAGGDDEIDPARIEATLRAKRATRP